MSKVKIQGHASGTGVLTVTAPNTSTDRTITLPDSTGTLATTGDTVPSGVIAMWHGASNAIPSGWVICDGNNSTPNLTDKFIKSTGTANATGGGTTSGSTTLTTSQIPSHTHTYNAGGHNSGHYTTSYGSGTHSVLGVGYVVGETSGATGGGGGHTHSQAEPVYFSLIFIMKT